MKNNKGITLIALVITIIVSLVIAGIALSLSLGNNGILEKSKKATIETNKSEEQEQIAFAWTTLTVNKKENQIKNIDESSFEEELNRSGNNARVDYINNNKNNFFLITFQDTNNQYIVDENGNIRVKEKMEKFEETYSYTGEEEEIILTKGKYLIECWGAQGGGETGGKGAYVCGELTIDKSCTVYAYVGSTTENSTGGYNGGGSGALYGGGGATDIRLVNGNCDNVQSLASRIIVAAGGGGCGGEVTPKYNGGYGGALVGGDGLGNDKGYGGNQIKGGKNATGGCLHDKNTANGSFGIGGSGTWCNESLGEGGAGYYGGSSGGGRSNNGSAGGGSSYVSGYEGCIAIKSADDITPKVSSYSQISDSYHYSGLIFENIRMIAGNEEMPSYNNDDTVIGNSGDGHLKITRMDSI